MYTHPANTMHQPNVGPMLGQRRRRWTNIGPTLGRCIVFAGHYPWIVAQQTQVIHTMMFQCCSSVEDGGPTLKRHWVNASWLLCENLRTNKDPDEQSCWSSVCAETVQRRRRWPGSEPTIARLSWWMRLGARGIWAEQFIWAALLSVRPRFLFLDNPSVGRTQVPSPLLFQYVAHYQPFSSWLNWIVHLWCLHFLCIAVFNWCEIEVELIEM